jgi:hypothetical protein
MKEFAVRVVEISGGDRDESNNYEYASDAHRTEGSIER